MKKIYLLIALLVCSQSFAQQMHYRKSEQSLFQRLTAIEKKSNRFNLYLNTQNSFDLNMYEGSTEQSGFYTRQLRIEAVGDINDKIYYRWRQRLNRSNTPLAHENQPTSIDYAAVGYRMTPTFSLFAGKQCAAYGGFEFDQNPIDIYEYCDMIEYMSNFMVGVTFGFRFSDSQELLVQVLNSRNGSFEETYGSLPYEIKPSDISLAYTLNWNAAFWDGLLKLRWSATIANQSHSRNMYYFAAGQQLDLGCFQTYIDFMLSREDIDRKRIISSFASDYLDGVTALNTNYRTLLCKVNYRVSPHLTLFAKGMYETASVFKSFDQMERGRYRTALGYLGGIEYYPQERSNLHFFACFVGRSYDFSDRAKELFNARNYHTQRVSVGFIYKLPMY